MCSASLVLVQQIAQNNFPLNLQFCALFFTYLKESSYLH